MTIIDVKWNVYVWWRRREYHWNRLWFKINGTWFEYAWYITIQHKYNMWEMWCGLCSSSTSRKWNISDTLKWRQVSNCFYGYEIQRIQYTNAALESWFGEINRKTRGELVRAAWENGRVSLNMNLLLAHFNNVIVPYHFLHLTWINWINIKRWRH